MSQFSSDKEIPIDFLLQSSKTHLNPNYFPILQRQSSNSTEKLFKELQPTQPTQPNNQKIQVHQSSLNNLSIKQIQCSSILSNHRPFQMQQNLSVVHHDHKILKLSHYKVVMRAFYKQIERILKDMRNEENNEWKIGMKKNLRNYQEKLKRKTYKYNIESMDRLFLKVHSLSEQILQKNREILISILQSQQFKNKILNNKYFQDKNRSSYLAEIRIIILKCRLPIKTFAQKIKQ